MLNKSSKDHIKFVEKLNWNFNKISSKTHKNIKKTRKNLKFFEFCLNY